MTCDQEGPDEEPDDDDHGYREPRNWKRWVSEHIVELLTLAVIVVETLR